MHDKRSDIIKFHFEHRSLALRQRKKLKIFLIQLFKNEGVRLSYLNYVFCTDNRLLTINLEFLNHNYYTDILTFNLSENPTIIEADIFISADRVKDNALLVGEYTYFELHRVIFHGALHLCGYKDHNITAKKEMRSMEDFYLAKYFK